MVMPVDCAIADSRQTKLAHFAIHLHLPKLRFDLAIAQYRKQRPVQPHLW
jgi:hypothetical protein